MIYSDELLAVAKCIFWFGTPEEALEFPKRFLTYAMTYGSDEDIEILRKYFSDADFRATLDIPRPGFSTEAHGPNGMSVTRPSASEEKDPRRRSRHRTRFLSPQVLKPEM